MKPLDQAVANLRASIVPTPPKTGLLGAFVGGSFQTRVATDPSLTYARHADGTTTRVKHHNRINLDSGKQSIPIQFDYDPNGDESIFGFEPNQAGAVIEGDPGAGVPSHTHPITDMRWLVPPLSPADGTSYAFVYSASLGKYVMTEGGGSGGSLDAILTSLDGSVLVGTDGFVLIGVP